MMDVREGPFRRPSPRQMIDNPQPVCGQAEFLDGPLRTALALDRFENPAVAVVEVEVLRMILDR